MQTQGGSSGVPVEVKEVPLEQLFNDARDEEKRTRALTQLVQPQGGSSGTPLQSTIPVQNEEVPQEQLFNDARDEEKGRQALTQLVQPQVGSSGTPPRSGIGILPTPTGTIFLANALPYFVHEMPYISIPRQVLEAVPPLEQFLNVVFDEQRRGPALVQLANMRATVPDFSLKVWHHPGMSDLILQEILRISHDMSQDFEDDFARVSCAIALLQPIAMDQRVRDELLRDKILDHLYLLLMDPKESKGFNKVRVAALGVIDGFVQKSNIRAVEHLLKSDIVALCIRCMRLRCALTISVAVLILARILRTEIGLTFICDDQERYLEIIHLLASMFEHPNITPPKLLLKWVIFCYYLFSFTPSVVKSLHKYIPRMFKDGSFRQLFQQDEGTLERAYFVIWKAYMHDA